MSSAARGITLGMHGIDAQWVDGMRAQAETFLRAKKSITSAARGAPLQLMEAAFARGSAASLATSPRQEGQAGRVERVEQKKHDIGSSCTEFGPLEYEKGVPFFPMAAFHMNVVATSVLELCIASGETAHSVVILYERATFDARSGSRRAKSQPCRLRRK